MITALIFMITLPSSFANDRELGIDEQCNRCSDYGLKAICQAEDLKSLSTIFVDSMDNMKSAGAVDAYVECQMKQAELFENADRKARNAKKENPKDHEQVPVDWYLQYQNHYRGYIAQASRSFGIPPQLFQCSLMIEGKYNKDTGNSSANARGLCQFNEITATQVSNVLKTAKAVKTPTTATDKKYANQLENWNNYFQSLKDDNRYSGSTPATFNFSEDTKSPQKCIAGAGLYYNDMMTIISSKLGVRGIGDILDFVDDGDRADATMNLMLVLGASYNMGPVGAGNILKNLGEPTRLKDMVALLEQEAPIETKKYIKSLRRCLTPGNFEAPEGWYSNPKSAPSCEEQKQIYESGGFNELMPLDEWE